MTDWAIQSVIFMSKYYLKVTRNEAILKASENYIHSFIYDHEPDEEE